MITDTIYVGEYVAAIHSIQNVEIRAKASGFPETIHVDEGQWVKEGQLLFVISRQQYQQDVLKAQAALTSALADAKAAEDRLEKVTGLTQKSTFEIQGTAAFGGMLSLADTFRPKSGKEEIAFTETV